ncbi:hypothetical protein KY332_04180 [Candidatus Woesearchaeota archaeon]|nr:hypothetical protein [Candidatus Woesearchaeota archaeon]
MKTHNKLIILLISIILFSLISNAKTVIEVDEGDFVNLKISASDADEDVITYTFSEPLDEDGQWQTGYGDYGEYLIDITVSDGKVETTETVKLIVHKTNWPPVLDPIEDVVIEEGETIIIEPNAYDEEGDKITYTFSDPIGENGIWETTYHDAGEYLITVTATDNQHDPISQDFTIIVGDVNQDPEVLDYFPDKADIKLDEGESQLFYIDAEDPDKHKLEYTWELNGEIVSKDKTYTFETGYESEGEYMLKGAVSDGKVRTGFIWDIKVEDSNRLPEVSEIEDIIVEEGDLITIEFTATDEDGDDVKYSISEPIGDDKEWQTGYDDAGAYEIELIISDGIDAVVKTFNIVVKDVDRAPDFAPIPDIEISEGQGIEIELEAEDPDGDSLTFEADELPEGAVLQENEFTFSTSQDTVLKPKNWFTSVLKFLRLDNIVYGDKKTFKIRFTVYGKELTNEQKAKITVNNINRAPELLDMGDAYVNEGETVYITPKALEQDNDRVKFTISDPVGNDGKWKTDYESAGVYEIQVTASDKEFTDSMNITLVVRDTNRPPEFSKIKDIEIKEGETVAITPVVIDPDGSEVELTIKNMPFDAKFEGNTFIWTPDYNTVDYRGGTTVYEIKFIATDSSQYSEKPVLITVEDVNQAPYFTQTSPATSIRVYKGITVLFKGLAEDPDGDELSYAWKFDMLDKIEDSVPGLKRTFNRLGDRTVKLIVSDGESEITRTWKINVVDNPLLVKKTPTIQPKPVLKPVEQPKEPEEEPEDKTYNLVVVYDGRLN